MKAFILIFILLSSSTYANTCTDYFHPFRVTRLEDLSEDEYEILETIARFELEARAILDAHLRNLKLADLNTHFEYLVQSKINPTVYYEIRESVSRNESSKAKVRNERIQELEAELELEKIQELEAQKIIEPVITEIERRTSFKGDSLQSLFDQALAAELGSTEQGIILQSMKLIFESENEYVRHKISTESKNKALELAIGANSIRISLINSHQFAIDILNFGANPNAITTDGMTMLHYALLKKNTGIFMMLITHKANINSTFDSNSILHTAVQTHHHYVQFLLENGANVHATNKDGETPLHLAVKRGDLESFKILLNYGANVNAANKDGKTPLQIANSKGYRNKNIQDLLKDVIARFHGKVERETSKVSKKLGKTLHKLTNPSNQKKP